MQKQEMILPLNTKIDLSLTKIDKFEKKNVKVYIPKFDKLVLLLKIS